MKTTEINIDQNIEDFYKSQLERTNYWLSYGEVKNGALLAFDVAFIGVIFTCNLDHILKTIVIVLILISTFTCLLSFVPDLDSKKETKKSCKKEELNILFFKDVTKFANYNEYIKYVNCKYFDGKDYNNNFVCDIASEIYINCVIATRKFNIFNLAIKFNISSIIVLLLAVIIA